MADTLSQTGSGPRSAVTLGDVRRLLANADLLGLTDDHIVEAVFVSPGHKHALVHFIHTRPPAPITTDTDIPADDHTA